MGNDSPACFYICRCSHLDLLLTRSDTLGEHRALIEARKGSWRDSDKVGLSPQPIRTDEGWLILYHGVKATAAGSIYRDGLALLDLEKPTRMIARSDDWVFSPEDRYERTGDVDNVVFPCG